jgi:hypothetical protein
MPYLNIDDGMPDHPKVEALSDAAFRLHVTAMAYCAHKMTDGLVERRKARRLTETASDVVVSELIGAGIWHDAGKGCTHAESVEERTCRADGVAGYYLLHDYLQWNHSREWWTKRRRDQAERKRKWKARQNGGRLDDE